MTNEDSSKADYGLRTRVHKCCRPNDVLWQTFKKFPGRERSFFSRPKTAALINGKACAVHDVGDDVVASGAW